MTEQQHEGPTPNSPPKQDAAKPMMVLPLEARQPSADQAQAGQRAGVTVNSAVLDMVTGRRVVADEAHIQAETRDLNHVVHKVLIAGLAVSMLLMLTGVGLDLLYHRELPTVIPSPTEALRRALALRPSGFLALGLLTLIGTPILRVVGSLIAFVIERDWRYAAITAIVLTVTIISIAFGAG